MEATLLALTSTLHTKLPDLDEAVVTYLVGVAQELGEQQQEHDGSVFNLQGLTDALVPLIEQFSQTTVPKDIFSSIPMPVLAKKSNPLSSSSLTSSAATGMMTHASGTGSSSFLSLNRISIGFIIYFALHIAQIC